MRRILWITGALLVLFLLVMQTRRPNFDLPKVHAAAGFDATMHPSQQISDTLHQSCYSCHSAQAEIPWYGHVWPASHLLQKDVRRGRARLDFSNWSNLSPEMSRIRLLNACQMMRESKMPLWYYRPLHPGATLQPEQVDAFCNWAQSLPAAAQTAGLR